MSMCPSATTAKRPCLTTFRCMRSPGRRSRSSAQRGRARTTITNLLNRFYEIHEGKIRYDGINIQKIKKADLRRSLAMVLQDTHLFTGTVEDNIRYGNLDATHEQVVAAAKLANADDFITRLPQGYDTVITGDGANLSQGQRQTARHCARRRSGPAGAGARRSDQLHRTRAPKALWNRAWTNSCRDARPLSSRTAFPPCATRMRSWCLNTAGSSSAATMKACLRKKAGITSCIPGSFELT